MNYITVGILGFTAAALLFGALVGMLRGRNRAALRLGLVVLSVVLAVLFRGTVADILLGIEVEGEPLREMLTAELTAEGNALPEAMVNLVFSLIEIAIGLVAFFGLFIILRLFTWILVFPILKIFVKRGESKGVGLGALFGLAQGLVIAFVICAPLTGIVTQVDRISNLKMNGEQLLEIPEEIGIGGYLDSAPAKIYSKAGGWFFNTVTSTKDANGNKVSIDDTCAIVETVVGIADTATQMSDSIEKITAENATAEERIGALHGIGDGLIAIGSSVDSLSSDAKQLVDELVGSIKELATEDGGEIPPEMAELFEDFSINDLKLDSAGKAINGIASYIEKTDSEFGSGESVTGEEIGNIVNGLADNPFVLKLIESASEGESIPAFIEVEDEYRSAFEDAISGTDLDSADKALLRSLFGLSS